VKTRHKLRQLLGRRARLARLEEEMREHIEMLAEENIRRGLEPAEARRRAQLAFGNTLSTREETEEALGWPRLESWAHDVRVAARSLARRPAFALSLVFILALGLGATTAIYSLLRGVLWDPLPVERPHELHQGVNPRGLPFAFSMPTVRRLEENGFRDGVIAYSGSANLSLRMNGAPAEPLRAQFVNGAFFTALRLPVAPGRPLLAADDELGAPRPVAVVSHQWWRRRLNADPAAVGRTLTLNGQEVTIVGIAAPSFAGVSLGSGIEVWLPAGLPAGLHAPLRSEPSALIVSRDAPPQREEWVRNECVAWLNVMLRVPPGANAQPALETAWRPQEEAVKAIFGGGAMPPEFAGNHPRLAPSPQGFSSTRNDFRGVGLTLCLLVAAVVLVTAANTSTLMLLRMLGRLRELGVRLALGASGGRLARAAMMEGLMLAFGGAAAGLLFGLWLRPLLGGWLVPGAIDTLPGLDWRLIGALCALALLLGLGLGAAPAWISLRLAPQVVLQQRVGGVRGSMRIGRALIVLQLALSVLLISVAVALALDLRRVLSGNLGYAREAVISASFDLRAAGFAPAAQAGVLERLRAAAQANPQVRAVGFAGSGALTGGHSASGTFFRGEGVRQPTGNVQHDSIDEHYFPAMGMALVRGRNFTAADTVDRPRVAILTQRLAREVFGDADPIGRRFGFDQTPAESDWEVIGLAPDARINGVREDPPAMYYLPLGQWRAPAGAIVVRVDGDASAARETVRRIVGAAEPGLMFARWSTLQERVQRWLRNDLAAARLTAGFGFLATVLAAIGVLGTLGYLVASRSRDIAVRLAIGAEPDRVWRGIVREALLLGVAGSGIGLLLAVLLPRVLGSWMMTGLRADTTAVAIAAVTGLCSAFIGSLRPARRASKVDPLTLLKAE